MFCWLYGFACCRLSAGISGAAYRTEPGLGGARIPSAAYPMTAVRPQFSRLSTERLERLFNVHPEPWEQALDGVLDTLFAGKSLS